MQLSCLSQNYKTHYYQTVEDDICPFESVSSLDTLVHTAIILLGVEDVICPFESVSSLETVTLYKATYSLSSTNE